MRSFILFTLLLLVILPSNCGAFQNKEQIAWLNMLSNQPKRFSYSMSMNGRLGFSQFPPQTDKHFSASDFYLHNTVLDELSLTPKKRLKIKKAFKQRKADGEKDQLDSGESEKVVKTFGRNMLKKTEDLLNQQLARTIASTLSTKQQKRLREIQLRFLVHQNGFFQVLNSKELRSFLDVPKLDAKEFEKRQREIATKILQQKKQSTIEACEIWLGDLSSEQRQVIDERWGPILNNGVSTQQLILQLHSKIERKEFDKSDPFTISKIWPSFEHDASGSCVVAAREKRTAPTSEVDKVRLIQSFMLSRHFQRDIELVAEQVEQNAEITKRFHEVKMTISREISEDMPATKRKQLFDKAIAKDAATYQNEYMNVLLPHQRDLLSLVVDNIVIRHQGPLAELLWGDLGRVLKLDDTTKEMLKTKADESRQFLENESKRIYDEAIEELIGVAPKTDQGKLRNILGPKFKDFHPNLDSLVVVLLEEIKTSEIQDER